MPLRGGTELHIRLTFVHATDPDERRSAHLLLTEEDTHGGTCNTPIAAPIELPISVATGVLLLNAPTGGTRTRRPLRPRPGVERQADGSYGCGAPVCGDCYEPEGR